MASINSLLNHEAAPAHAHAHAHTHVLAQSPREQQQQQQQPPATTARAEDARYALAALAPIEPEPSMEQHQPYSPTTLDQYHHGSHGSKSPEEQRRQSLFSRTSPVPILAPIQNLTGVLHARINDEPQEATMAFGPDLAQLVPPPSRTSNDGETARDETQDREPAVVRNEPSSASMTPHALPTTKLPSPQPYIKNEPSGTPRESTPSTTTMAQPAERRRSPAADPVDADALKALELSKQIDLGLRAKRTGSVAESLVSPTEAKPVLPPATKKRPAPSAIKKKGTAALKKPASKKRKLDPEELPDAKARSLTPSSRTSKTPAAKISKKGSQRGTPAAESSPAPDNSSQAHASDDEVESSEDNALYCICRKPDNHKWMIACDGGCEDWFHGSCVDMQQADEDLLDHFICPNCEAATGTQTTWKPMCRRQDCRKPARVGTGKDSKYCSDECGVLFFQEQVKRTAGTKKRSKKTKKKGTKDGEGDADGDEPMFDDDEEPTPLGGVLRSKDLKALVLEAKNVNEFKQLGSGVLSPPQTASPTQNSFNNGNGTEFKLALNLDYTPSEMENLKALNTEKSQLHVRLELLKAREKFVSMVREQAVRYAEREKMKAKDFCGYDSRLAWTDQEFEKWWTTKEGIAAFKSGSLTPDSGAANGVDGDAMDLDAPNGVNGEVKPKGNICMKKRCAKHPQWQKLTIQDARFEEIEVSEAIKEVEKEERQVLERAKRRTEKNKVAAELTGGGEVKEERNREGWVEIVGA